MSNGHPQQDVPSLTPMPVAMVSGMLPERGVFVYWINPFDHRKMHLSTMTSRHLRRDVYAELEVMVDTGQVVPYRLHALPRG